MILENNSYQGFAKVYDEMMGERDYKRWAVYVNRLASDYGLQSPVKMLDLACGTGSFLLEIAERGWSVVGVDNSADMLGVAHDKLTRSNHRFTLIQQDMRQLDLGQEYSLITCLCDSLNYLITPDDLQQTFERAKRHLAPGGILIADMNLEAKYRWMLGNGSFAATFENSAYIWENSYDSETRICRMEIDFFVRENGELFRHIPEVHLQRGYMLSEIESLGKKAGFSMVEFWQAFTDQCLNPEDEETDGQELLEGCGSEEYRYEDGRVFIVMR